MKKLVDWFRGTRFYLQLFCGYEFKVAKSSHLCRVQDVWENHLMVNGWDVHKGVNVDNNGKFYVVCFRIPLLDEYAKAAKEFGYDCTGDEFYLMAVRGEVDWSRQPEWVYFSERFRDVFDLEQDGQ